MRTIIYPGYVSGEISAPSSKSFTQRALAAALLSKSTVFLHHCATSTDASTTLAIIKNLGALITQKDQQTLKIESRFPDGVAKNLKLDCYESGLAMRMFTSVAALSNEKIKLDGQPNLKKRPLLFSEEDFKPMSVALNMSNNGLPFTITGPLQPVSLNIKADQSSQFLTGLLLAYSAAGAQNCTIKVAGLVSKSYIDMTLEVMQDFGLPVPKNHDYQEFYFPPLQESQKAKSDFHYTIEGDWSNAAFFLVAGANAGSVLIKGLNPSSVQGDRKILEVIQNSGAHILQGQNSIQSSKPTLGSFYFDATDLPDLFPPLAVLAALCPGMSVIKGIHRLVYKESNRADALWKEFQKVGARIQIQDDKLIIEGGSIAGGTVNGHQDHRIVMAMAILALSAKTPITIEGSEAVNKSYPEFWDDLKKIGVRLKHL